MMNSEPFQTVKKEAAYMKIAMFGIKGVPVPAGAENVAEQIGSRLVERGHQVTLYVRPHYTPASLKEYKGMRLVHLPSIPTKNLDAITHSFLASIAVLFSDADIVHIHSTGNSIFSFLPRVFGKKTIVQSHGLDWQRAKWGAFARAYLKMTDYTTVYFPSLTTVVSKKMKIYYEKISKKDIFYIPNGVGEAKYYPVNEIRKWGLKGNDYILFAARLVPEKGAHYLIDAYCRINNPKKKLIIAGDANYKTKYLEDLQKRSNKNIIFTGFVTGDAMLELLSNAFLYTLPSEIEGLSTGLLEAMSHGNCVLVSNIEENIEAIGEAGITFESKNVDDLEKKLRDLLTDENKIDLYRKLALKHVYANYDWERIVNQFEDLYQK